MMKLLTTLALSAAALVPSPATKPQPKPAPQPAGTVIVKLLPGVEKNAVKADGDYVVDPGFSQEPVKDADARYQEMKDVLDERFDYMFQLKKELDAASAATNAKWDEYYQLRQAYEKQLKKLIADWVTDQQYQAK